MNLKIFAWRLQLEVEIVCKSELVILIMLSNLHTFSPHVTKQVPCILQEVYYSVCCATANFSLSIMCVFVLTVLLLPFN